LAVIGLFLLLLWPLLVSVRRAADLFVVRVRGGRAVFVRGRMPQSLLHDISDVVRSPPVSEAVLRVVRRSGEAELLVEGEVSEGQRQQLRNAIGRFSVQRIMGGGRPARPKR
jgi:hypothetical protein